MNDDPLAFISEYLANGDNEIMRCPHCLQSISINDCFVGLDPEKRAKAELAVVDMVAEIASDET